MTWLARERRAGLPSVLLEVPDVKAAIERGYLRVVEQMPDAAPAPAAPAPVAPAPAARSPPAAAAPSSRTAPSPAPRPTATPTVAATKGT